MPRMLQHPAMHRNSEGLNAFARQSTTGSFPEGSPLYANTMTHLQECLRTAPTGFHI
ncbi:hypothetical protein WJX79_007366 [Trebouxia sp. C0005]